jgi:hypothetical protein
MIDGQGKIVKEYFGLPIQDAEMGPPKFGQF